MSMRYESHIYHMLSLSLAPEHWQFCWCVLAQTCACNIQHSHSTHSWLTVGGFGSVHSPNLWEKFHYVVSCFCLCSDTSEQKFVKLVYTDINLELSDIATDSYVCNYWYSASYKGQQGSIMMSMLSHMRMWVSAQILWVGIQNTDTTVSERRLQEQIVGEGWKRGNKVEI